MQMEVVPIVGDLTDAGLHEASEMACGLKKFPGVTIFLGHSCHEISQAVKWLQMIEKFVLYLECFDC